MSQFTPLGLQKEHQAKRNVGYFGWLGESCRNFSIKANYEILIAAEPKVEWGNIMIRNRAAPNARFFTCLAVQNRFLMKD